MGAELDRLSSGNYVLVTTFRRDGTAVPTPVWVARDGAELVIWSATKAGKVQRIRRSGDVEVIKPAATGEHAAAVLDPAP